MFIVRFVLEILYNWKFFCESLVMILSSIVIVSLGGIFVVFVESLCSSNIN